MDNQIFGESLKKARKKAGLSQAQLAEMVGMSQTVITKYEHETRNPSLEVMLKIANVLGMDTSEIYESVGITMPSQFSDKEHDHDNKEGLTEDQICDLAYKAGVAFAKGAYEATHMTLEVVK